jgi:hypothetical protein
MPSESGMLLAAGLAPNTCALACEPSQSLGVDPYAGRNLALVGFTPQSHNGSQGPAPNPPLALKPPGALSPIQLAARSREGARAARTILGARFVRSPTVRERTKIPVYDNRAKRSPHAAHQNREARVENPARAPAAGTSERPHHRTNECGRHVARLTFHKGR